VTIRAATSYVPVLQSSADRDAYCDARLAGGSPNS
jgi:hypothetical protein